MTPAAALTDVDPNTIAFARSPDPGMGPSKPAGGPGAGRTRGADKGGCCALGLRRRVLPQGGRGPALPEGPPISLCEGMHLGRTPTGMRRAMASLKPLDQTWTARDVEAFRKGFSRHARSYALLGIGCDEPIGSGSTSNSGSTGSGTTGSGSTSSAFPSRSVVMAISRKLLSVEASSPDSLTLRRCPEASTTESGNLAKPVPVAVERKSGGAPTDVPPSSEVTLFEGDVLSIHGDAFSYQVVRWGTAGAATKPSSRSPTRTESRSPGLGRTGRSSLADRTVCLEDPATPGAETETEAEAAGEAEAEAEAPSLPAASTSEPTPIQTPECGTETDRIMSLMDSSSDSSDANDNANGNQTDRIMSLLDSASDGSDANDNDNANGNGNGNGSGAGTGTESPSKSPEAKAKAKAPSSAAEASPPAAESAAEAPSQPGSSTSKTSPIRTPECGTETNRIMSLLDSPTDGSGVVLRRSSRRVKKKTPWTQDEPKVTTKPEAALGSSGGNDTETPCSSTASSLTNRLKLGPKIRSIVLMDENNNETEEVFKPAALPTTTKAKAAPRGQASGSGRKLPPVPLVSPLEKFWDSSWSGSRAKATGQPPPQKRPRLSGVGEAPAAAVPPPGPPRDMSVSLSSVFWKSINSSRPREGALYLHTAMVATQTIPSAELCKQWLELLTWGPQRTHRRPSTGRSKQPLKGFFWDGPRMDHSLAAWKKALSMHPSVLLPRMLTNAPGGAADWWKTCLEHDDLEARALESGDEPEPPQESAAEKCRRETGMLRMRSLRIEVLVVLLRTSLALEKEGERARDRAGTNLRGAEDHDGRSTSSADSGTDSDSESDGEPEEPERAQVLPVTPALLSEIRGFGSRAALGVAARAMARFRVAEKESLGYHGDDSGGGSSGTPASTALFLLQRDRSSAVQAVASGMADALGWMARAASAGDEDGHPCRRRRRRRRGRKATPGSSFGTDRDDAGDAVWTAMDHEVRRGLPRRSKKSRGAKANPSCCTPEDSFLLEWLLALRGPLGTKATAGLSERLGLARDFAALAMI